MKICISGVNDVPVAVICFHYWLITNPSSPVALAAVSRNTQGGHAIPEAPNRIAAALFLHQSRNYSGRASMKPPKERDFGATQA